MSDCFCPPETDDDDDNDDDDDDDNFNCRSWGVLPDSSCVRPLVLAGTQVGRC